jgi:hypothetical protein
MRTITLWLQPKDRSRDAVAQQVEPLRPLSEAELGAVVGAGGPASGGVGSGGGAGGSGATAGRCVRS